RMVTADSLRDISSPGKSVSFGRNLPNDGGHSHEIGHRNGSADIRNRPGQRSGYRRSGRVSSNNSHTSGLSSQARAGRFAGGSNVSGTGPPERDRRGVVLREWSTAGRGMIRPVSASAASP